MLRSLSRPIAVSMQTGKVIHSEEGYALPPDTPLNPCARKAQSPGEVFQTQSVPADVTVKRVTGVEGRFL